MKLSPELARVQDQMQPGCITRDGFLGEDTRPLNEILEADEQAVRRLGLTHERIADRLDELAARAREGLGTTVTVEGRFDVRAEDVRGKLPCPWTHRGLYPKTNFYLTNTSTGEQLTWTALLVHLVRAHGFYEGRGSAFRLGPREVARVLELEPTEGA
jgi:hypothetical protein